VLRLGVMVILLVVRLWMVEILLVVRLWMMEILLVAISLRVVIHTSPPSSSSSYSCWNTGQKDSKFPNLPWASLGPPFISPCLRRPPETASARAPMHSSARACACIAAGRRQQGKLESLLAGGCNASEWRRRWAAVVPAALRRLLFRHAS